MKFKIQISRSFLFTVIGVSIALKLYSQMPTIADPSQIRTVPPAPTAAGLGKFGSMPVSYYTGVPQISIPLHTISYGDITLPITLDYHAGGIRVEEIASWVGLGWSLNAGGVITRTVHGICDELRFGYQGYGANISTFFQNMTDGNSGNNVGLIDDVYIGNTDTEPDIYTYNFAGQSGKFFIGYDGVTVYTVPQSPLKISFSGSFDNNNFSWKIVTPDGFTYVFGYSAAQDGTEYNSTTNFSGTNNPYNSVNASNTTKIISSWYLVSMTSPRGFTLNFTYTPFQYTFTALSGEHDEYGLASSTAGGGNIYNYSTTQNVIAGKRLSAITFLNGSVSFVPGAYRYDLIGDQVLSQVQIYSGANNMNLIKSYGFNYGYFMYQGILPASPQTTWSQTVEVGSSIYRLKLQSMTETGSDNSTKPPYLFSYLDESVSANYKLPPRLDQTIANQNNFNTPAIPPGVTYGQDHWGFYNGQTANVNSLGFNTLVPTFDFNPGGAAPTSVIPGAIRASNQSYALAYSLNQITYPTGGTSTFTLESNMIPSSMFPVSLANTYTNAQTPGCRLQVLAGASGSTSCPFTINSSFTNSSAIQGAYVTLSILETQCGSQTCQILNSVVVSVTTTTGTFIANATNLNGQQVFFPNGSYNLVITNSNSMVASTMVASANWVSQSNPSTGSGPVVDVAVGGLRVKTIADYDGINHANDVIRNFSYQKLDGSGISSGVMQVFPSYGGQTYAVNYCQATIGAENVYTTNYYLVMDSYTCLPLATTQGSSVGYQNVTVTLGASGTSGQTQYTYTTASLYPDVVNQTFPYPPISSVDWQRGLLLEQTDFKYNVATSSYVMIKDQKNNYTFYTDPSLLYYYTSGLKFGLAALINPDCGSTPTPGQTRQSAYSEYGVPTQWYVLSSTTANTYDDTDPTQFQQQVVTFQYNNKLHQQVSVQSVQTSETNTVQTQYMHYPWDFPPASTTTGIQQLQTNNIVGEVVEEYIEVSPLGATPVVTQGLVNSYTVQPGTTMAVKNASYILETTNPIPTTGTGAYVPLTTTTASLNLDTRYQPRIQMTYDANGNLLQYFKPNGVTPSNPDVNHALQWSYNNVLPIAEVVNATPNEFFYESFENATGALVSTVAHCGKKYWSTSYTTTFSIPDSRSYLIEYWTLNTSNNTWQYNTATYTGVGMVLTGSGIDDVRIYPTDAQMKSYTYDPVNGMTSSIDVNSRTYNYDYDPFGRLLQIRNDNGFVEKKYQYNYKGAN